MINVIVSYVNNVNFFDVIHQIRTTSNNVMPMTLDVNDVNDVIRRFWGLQLNSMSAQHYAAWAVEAEAIWEVAV